MATATEAVDTPKSLNKRYPNPLRAWCFTVFNYTPEDEARIVGLASTCERLVCGREVCPTSGTPHLQGYIKYKRSVRADWVRAQIKDGCHVEPRYAKKESTASTYCKKDGDLLIDHGLDCDPDSRKRSRDEETDEVIAEIEKGEPYGRIRNRHKRFVFWHRRNVVEYMRDHVALASDPAPVDS